MFKEKVRVQILEGKLTDRGKCLCGSYRGYEIMVNQMNGFYQICINAHSDDDVNNQKLAAFLAEHKTKVKGVLDAKISPTALLMNVKMPAFGSKCPAAINEDSDAGDPVPDDGKIFQRMRVLQVRECTGFRL